MTKRLKVQRMKDVGDDIHGFKIDKVPECHGQICGLLDSLGLDEKSILEFDFPYEGIDGEHIAAVNDDFRVDLFIAGDYLYLVIERRNTQLTKKEVMDKLRKFLEF